MSSPVEYPPTAQYDTLSDAVHGFRFCTPLAHARTYSSGGNGYLAQMIVLVLTAIPLVGDV